MDPNEPAILDLVDMYRLDVRLCLTFASTLEDPSLLADPVLFLFDSLGRGVAMDDESGDASQAFLGVLNNLAAGEYYLAIAFAGMEPVDAGGNPIFDTFGNGGVLSNDALAAWSGSPFAIDPSIPGNYELSAANVPVPGTALLAAMGLVGIARRRFGQA